MERASAVTVNRHEEVNELWAKDEETVQRKQQDGREDDESWMRHHHMTGAGQVIGEYACVFH